MRREFALTDAGRAELGRWLASLTELVPPLERGRRLQDLGRGSSKPIAWCE